MKNKQAIIVGNWKMNKTQTETSAFLKAFLPRLTPREAEVVICPPFTSLAGVQDAIKGTSVALGAQTIHSEDNGAFTGEISGPMLKDFNCQYVIIGHSERRQYFQESDAICNSKVKATQRNAMIPILCVGETLDQRESGQTFEHIKDQLQLGLDQVLGSFLVAYEPIWAIGTGKVATPQEAQDVHLVIREKLADIFGQEKATDTPVLYGGSVKPENAKALIVQADIDGFLVGGASLDATQFSEIISQAT